MASASPRAASSRSVAYLAFFLSGASSLIFQTIWTRMLHHVFGATSVAISTVLTVFMAGLGLGAWLGGKYANKIKHPIIAYAVAEIGVGLWGLVVPLLVRSDGWLATVNAFLRAEFGAESGMFMIARFLCVAPILIIPTTLMGSTLPLLTRHFVATTHGARDAGAKVGVLYAINTFGASTGPLLSAFFLLPYYGLSVANIVACSMNFTLAALIFATRKSLLAGMWKPGEPLRFWPGTAEVAKEGVVAAETFEDLDPADAKVGAYRDTAEPVVEDGEDPDALKKRKKRKRAASAREAEEVRAARREAVGKVRLAIRLTGVFVMLTLAGGLGAADNDGVRAMFGTLLIVVTFATAYFSRDRDDLGPQEEEGEEEEDERPVPELARKAAFLAFAASGAAALCYEVVWSRALAMTIGSSIYSFSLILETFLIGIAAGSAAMSAFMGRKASPIIGIGITSAILVLFANVTWAIDIVDPADVEHRFAGSTWAYLLRNLCFIAPIALGVIWVSFRVRRTRGDEDAFRDDLAVWKPLLTVAIAALPVIAAGINAGHFPGYLPQIILTVVAAVALFLVVTSLLAQTPVLLVAIVQLFIAGATIISYYWQDDIPYAFAQLVAGIPTSSLPDQVGTVQFFMFVTIVLCTLPATLGMGAMFPLTVRLWTQGGEGIARDVAVVYTGNTLGSIVGAWLPGFILFALVGAEKTLHLGIALNLVLALVLLIAGAADPGEDQSWWTWRRVGAVGLPILAGVVMAVDGFSGGMAHPELLIRLGSAVGFIALGIIEYQWLRRCGSDERPSPIIAAAMAGVPLITTVALAQYLSSPADTDEWAVRAVVIALKGFLVFVGALTAWNSWREWATSAPPASSSSTPSGA